MPTARKAVTALVVSTTASLVYLAATTAALGLKGWLIALWAAWAVLAVITIAAAVTARRIG